MDRSLKTLLVTLLIPFILIIIGMLNFSLILISFGLLLACIILSLFVVGSTLYRVNANKKQVKQLESEYELELLDNTENEVFLLKKKIGNYNFYIFSYLNQNGEKVIQSKQDIDIKNLDKEKSYVKIYKNTYIPKGLLDWMFYTDEIKKRYETICELYISEEKIKLD